nr:SDR family NAD(P)-dependent oxidoreductase [Oceanicoccus sp. KOV_DT_Chl]
MDLQLQNKKAIVSGGSRGIGLAIVERLLTEGASVAFFARGEAGVTEAVNALSAKYGGDTIIIGDSVDAADYDAVSQWVKSAAERLGVLILLLVIPVPHPV